MSYGVTPTQVGSLAHGLALSATTKPTTAQTTEIIDLYSLYWDSFLESKGFTAATIQADSTTAGYQLGKQWVSFRACAEALEARLGKTTSLSESLMAKANAIWTPPANLAEVTLGSEFSTANGKRCVSAIGAASSKDFRACRSCS